MSGVPGLGVSVPSVARPISACEVAWPDQPEDEASLRERSSGGKFELLKSQSKRRLLRKKKSSIKDKVRKSLIEFSSIY